MKIRFPSLVKSGKQSSNMNVANNNTEKSTNSNSNCSDESSCSPSKNNDSYRSQRIGIMRAQKSPLTRLRRGISPLRSMSPLRSRQRMKSYPSILTTKGTKSNRFYNHQQCQEQEQQQQQEKAPSTNSIGSSNSVASSVDSTIISAVDTTIASSSFFRPVISVNIQNNRTEDIENDSLSSRTVNDDDNEIPETETNTCSTNVTPNILTKDFEQYFKIMIKNSENIIGSDGIRNNETTRDKGCTENKNKEKKQLVAPPIETKEGELEEGCRPGSQWVLNQRFVLSDIGKDAAEDPSDDCVAKVDLLKAKARRGKRTFNSSLSEDDKPFIDNSDSDSHSSSSSSSSSDSSNNKDENYQVINMNDDIKNPPSNIKDENNENMNYDIKNPPIGSLTIIDANHSAGGYNNDSTNCRTRNDDDDADEDEFPDGKSEGERTVAQGLALKLIRDLESVRQENERCTARNRRLQSQLHKLKANQDEHMVHRIRLLKACIYTMPVFVLCGGLDAFLTTILLVWVLVEVDSYMDLGDEGLGGDNDDSDDDSDDEDDLDDLDDLDSNNSNDDEDEDDEDEDEDEESRNQKYFRFLL